jgi:hypothetical protein
MMYMIYTMLKNVKGMSSTLILIVTLSVIIGLLFFVVYMGVNNFFLHVRPSTGTP